MQLVVAVVLPGDHWRTQTMEQLRYRYKNERDDVQSATALKNRALDRRIPVVGVSGTSLISSSRSSHSFCFDFCNISVRGPHYLTSILGRYFKKENSALLMLPDQVEDNDNEVD